jgi:hypothetical protein
MLSKLIQVYLKQNQSPELQIILLEMLTSISPDSWKLLFTSDEHEEIVNTLVNMK